ncbi:hypothetical protein ACFWUU_17800 [Kribbella sp. NPDC058693]|uniref:hypothetical protein n=1 Tax=Kribbella sp. NPDC058693 TaxID=3346602 RepID=UPI003647FF47
MDNELVGQIVVAIGGVLSAGVPLIGNRNNRKSLRDDADRDIAAMNALPETHPARDAYDALIKRQAVRMSAELDLRRDPFGIGLAVAFIVIGSLGGVLIFQDQSISRWWLIGVALAFLFGSAGLAQDASKRKRDDKGRPVDGDQEKPIDVKPAEEPAEEK